MQHGHPTPLVGRDAEDSALALGLRMAKRGAFRCIVIDGEPGVGKTRLATDLLERSRGRVITLRARGHLVWLGLTVWTLGGAFGQSLEAPR